MNQRHWLAIAASMVQYNADLAIILAYEQTANDPVFGPHSPIKKAPSSTASSSAVPCSSVA
jgi:hypothetical protein